MIKKQLKNIFFNIHNLMNTNKKYIKNIQNNNYLTILNLHKVSLENNPFYPPLTPLLFEELIKYIIENFNVITFNQITSQNNSKKPDIILSFDDGYYDFLEHAMPIMKKYNIKANLNIIPSCIENQEPMWNIKLYDFLNSSPLNLIKEIKIDNFNYQISKKNKDKFGMLLGRHLKQMQREKREKILETLQPIFEKNSNIKYTRMLNKKEILEISKNHEIGVHSYSHESMGYESDDFFREDFFKCQEYFKNILQLPMDIYAFPNGSYRENQLEFLFDNNINSVLLVNNAYSKYNTKTHNRFTYYADSESEAKLRAVGFYR